MRTYEIEYREYSAAEVKTITVKARNKYEAYDLAVYEILDCPPFSAWVAATITKEGKRKMFNTHEGNPY